jgi:hypothetical protein
VPWCFFVFVSSSSPAGGSPVRVAARRPGSRLAARPGNGPGGLPDLPNLLAFLTGGSALTYSVNKGVTTNQPALTAVHPQSARIGDLVTAYGNNLTTVSTTETLKAAVAGVDAAIPKSAAAVAGGSVVAGAMDEVTFFVPSPPTSAA